MEAIPDTDPTFMTEGKAPPPEELTEDDLGDLEQLVSGVTQTSQSTLLLKKRKEMREVDDALEFMKEEYESRMAEVLRGQVEFEKKQVDMKKMVSKFDKFIQENDAKRTRAELKAKQEEALRHQHEEEIASLTRELADLKAQYDELQLQLNRLKKYQNFLESVTVEVNDEYQEINDVVNRHKTLQDAHEDLDLQSSGNHEDIEEVRGALQQMRQKQQNEVLVLNSVVQQRQKTMEELRAEVAELDIDKESRDRTVKDKTMEFGAVLMSIKNLYLRCFSTAKVRMGKQLREPKPGEDLFGYLNACLDAVAWRIEILDETESSHDDYLAELRREEAAKARVARDTRANAGLTDDRRRAMRGEHKSGGGAHTGTATGRTAATGAGAASDISGVGFAPDGSTRGGLASESSGSFQAAAGAGKGGSARKRTESGGAASDMDTPVDTPTPAANAAWGPRRR